MSAAFSFAALTAEVEAWLVVELGLEPVVVPKDLAGATGTWKGAPVRIATHAYRGGPVRYARFVRLVGADLEIGNVLCLPDPVYPLPILGADLVGLRRTTGMLAADLSPTLPPGRDCDDQLAPLARRRSAHPDLPFGGALPAWCAAWFSPHALYTRVAPDQLPAAVAAFWDYPRAFVELTRRTRPRPELTGEMAARQDGYAAAHRTDDKGLVLLAKMFGDEWAGRYLEQVLFPSTPPPSTSNNARRSHGGRRWPR